MLQSDCCSALQYRVATKINMKICKNNVLVFNVDNRSDNFHCKVF